MTDHDAPQACAHRHVEYCPEEVGAMMRDRWLCTLCGTEFAPGGQVQDELDATKGALEDCADKLVAAEDERARLRRDLDQWRERWREKRDAVGMLGDELSEQQAEIEHERTLRQKYARDLDAYTSQLSEERQAHGVVLRSWEEHCERLRAAETNSDSEISELSDQIERLQAELEHSVAKAQIEHDKFLTALKRSERLQAERDLARRAVKFFASAIKSGEPWTAECEYVLRRALDDEPQIATGQEAEKPDDDGPTYHDVATGNATGGDWDYY